MHQRSQQWRELSSPPTLPLLPPLPRHVCAGWFECDPFLFSLRSSLPGPPVEQYISAILMYWCCMPHHPHPTSAFSASSCCFSHHNSDEASSFIHSPRFVEGQCTIRLVRPDDCSNKSEYWSIRNS